MEDKLKDDDEIEVDLGKLFGILWDRKKVAGGIIAACTLIAMIISLIIPPTFESNTLVQTNSTNKLGASGASAAMAMLGVGSGASSPTMNYMEMMKSRTVLDPIIDQLEDITPEEREEMTAASFAKKHLNIENVKGTNLINVVGKGRTPEEAQMISANVVENFLKMMTEINQSSQSFMVKFLNERIDTAKKESDEAAAKLEAYSKEHKVYYPDDQSKAVLERTALFDKAIGDLQVKQQAASAKLAAVDSELGKQNANLSAYNVADNDVVVTLREQIANQEVAIVKLEQKYTENHPDLINARKTLQAMKENLTQEVAAAVAGGTATMNPTQAALVQAQAMAQVEMAVASASEAAVRAQMANSESDMAQLSEAALGYLKLKRDANIKNEIYVALVRQSEQSRIQATMESMDIQVIDKANLPIRRSAPRRTIITLGGMALGILLSLLYGFRLYKKEELV
ncbi:Wzz/FepE/Etk N-terminal domain-containing protein [uncultured Anaerovibrio sp.]|uniref:GumC family protein n=1 Tax=uncultured Anaerovibrio sp. TaxID=361586 RepID=UPI002629CA71|nr:Wzz/FepE/Etk N-terminal domain-containing protein [uncultured Anaerovibrio sp.]